MIKIEITVKCKRCGSDDLVKNGPSKLGKQRYRCMNCDTFGTINEEDYKTKSELKQTIMKATSEKSSLRGLSRIFNVSRNTISEWRLDRWFNLPKLETTLIPFRKDDILEFDELWSFVYSKDEKEWIWLCLSRRTRQIIASHIGDRSAESCKALWNKIPKDYKKCKSYSDFYEVYQAVLPKRTHKMVGKDSGETNHIERFNNTLRQRIGRLVRSTLSFSKSSFNHLINLELFIFDYNKAIYENFQNA